LIKRLLAVARQPPQVASLGAFMPEPPHYTETLVEVIERFAAAPNAAGDAPRVADWHAARAAAAEAADTLWPRFVDEEESLRLIRLVRTFLTTQADVPSEVFRFGDAAPAEAPHEKTAQDVQANRGARDGEAKLFE
jgi:hypothetical protein